MHVADTLSQSILNTQSIACIGLDPRPALIPPDICARAQDEHGSGMAALCSAFERYNIDIIDAIAGSCAAVKPQVACYEAYGWQGMRVLENTIAHAHSRGIPVIVDGKRNDIGSTATHYQQAWLGQSTGFDDSIVHRVAADWLTINAYLGSDGVTPFLDSDDAHGVFALVKTSNPSSADLQGQSCGDSTVMEQMAHLVNHWGAQRLGTCGLSSVGAVVGATWPDEARQLRSLMPNTLFLVPGYGAQGGSAADALAGMRPDGQGVLINSSRAIIGAWAHTDAPYVDAIRDALHAMNRDLNLHR